MTSHIADHLSPDFHDKDMWVFMFMLAFALFALTQERRLPLREALLLSGWAIMGLYSVRNIPLFAVITAPIYGVLIQPWVEKMLDRVKPVSGPRESEEVLRGHVWVIIPVLFFGFLLWRGIPIDQKGTGNVFLPDKMPVQAMDWLEKNPQSGKMFNQFVWGGYILYRSWPEQKVFIDGEALFYGEALFREYLNVIELHDGWQKVLDEHNVSWMLVPRNETLAKYLYTVDDDAWYVVYEDKTAVIFRRDFVQPAP